MIIKPDWSKIFTQAFRTAEHQEKLNDMFRGKQETKVTRADIEYMVVRSCSLLMQELEKKNG